MTMKVVGVTYENRQEVLAFIESLKGKTSFKTYLMRDRKNRFDRDAVAVVVQIGGVGYATIGYVPSKVAASIAPIIDKGLRVTGSLLEVIGGYGDKQTRGALINIQF